MKKNILVLLTAIGLLLSVQSHAGLFSDFFKPKKTKHPIMLVPGIFAFDTIASVDYWYQIPSSLEKYSDVYVAKINAFDNSANRGETLINQLDEIQRASEGKITKFNLISHSQGGMTARYVMAVRPDLVASVTTMATPHTGAPIADIVSDMAPEGTVQGMMFEQFANAIGNLVNLLSDNKKDKSDIYAMLGEFNATGSAKFNERFPLGVPEEHCGTGPASVEVEGHSIHLFSWGGASHITSGLDLSDALFVMTGLAFEGEPNDGITGVCANHFGTVLRDDYNMNHLDINNHVLGLVSLFETNPKTLYKNHAKRLTKIGL